MDEARLIRRLRRRDEHAFTVVVERHQSRVFSLCFRMLGNAAEAEDIAQETFVKCFIAIGSFRGDAALSTWLYRIAMNLCKNRLKYLGRRAYSSTAPIDDVFEGTWDREERATSTVGESAPRPDQALEGDLAERRVQAALCSLDDEFRELLVLRDIEGLCYQEIVDITGLPAGTVKSRLHRARAALQRAYERLEGT